MFRSLLLRFSNKHLSEISLYDLQQEISRRHKDKAAVVQAEKEIKVLFQERAEIDKKIERLQTLINRVNRMPKTKVEAHEKSGARKEL